MGGSEEKITGRHRVRAGSAPSQERGLGAGENCVEINQDGGNIVGSRHGRKMRVEEDSGRDKKRGQKKNRERWDHFSVHRRKLSKKTEEKGGESFPGIVPGQRGWFRGRAASSSTRKEKN